MKSMKLAAAASPQAPKSPLSIDDRTVKVDNSLTKQRSSLVRMNSATPNPKMTPRGAAVKAARMSTGSMLTSNATSYKSYNLLSLSLSASSSRESNCDNEEAVKGE